MARKLVVFRPALDAVNDLVFVPQRGLEQFRVIGKLRACIGYCAEKLCGHLPCFLAVEYIVYKAHRVYLRKLLVGQRVHILAAVYPAKLRCGAQLAIIIAVAVGIGKRVVLLGLTVEAA